MLDMNTIKEDLLERRSELETKLETLKNEITDINALRAQKYQEKDNIVEEHRQVSNLIEYYSGKVNEEWI